MSRWTCSHIIELHWCHVLVTRHSSTHHQSWSTIQSNLIIEILLWRQVAALLPWCKHVVSWVGRVWSVNTIVQSPETASSLCHLVPGPRWCRVLCEHLPSLPASPHCSVLTPQPGINMIYIITLNFIISCLMSASPQNVIFRSLQASERLKNCIQNMGGRHDK